MEGLEDVGRRVGVDHRHLKYVNYVDGTCEVILMGRAGFSEIGVYSTTTASRQLFRHNRNS